MLRSFQSLIFLITLINTALSCFLLFLSVTKIECYTHTYFLLFLIHARM
nr:MAG TPA: hypothetical protein [Caudoviricetes sp.]DAW46910.1 MAG TPA: hypothetical protein [Caudoviricetes sp.]